MTHLGQNFFPFSMLPSKTNNAFMTCGLTILSPVLIQHLFYTTMKRNVLVWPLPKGSRMAECSMEVPFPVSKQALANRKKIKIKNYSAQVLT